MEIRLANVQVYTVANKGQDSYVFRGWFNEIVERPILRRVSQWRKISQTLHWVSQGKYFITNLHTLQAYFYAHTYDLYSAILS